MYHNICLTAAFDLQVTVPGGGLLLDHSGIVSLPVPVSMHRCVFSGLIYIHSVTFVCSSECQRDPTHGVM